MTDTYYALAFPITARSGRVLLVEDTPASRIFAVNTLEQAGHHVLQAASAEEALSVLASEPCDMALVDMRLPDFPGDELARRIRNTDGGGWDPAIPLVAMSASNMEEDRLLCLQAGMDDYLIKPVNGEALLRVVATAMNLAAQRDAPHKHHAHTPPVGLLDVDAALSRLNGKLQLYQRMAEEFLRESVEMNGQLRRALDKTAPSKADHALALRLAHSLKDCADMLGARALRSIAADMESALRDMHLAQARVLAPALAATLDETLVLLSQHVTAN